MTVSFRGDPTRRTRDETTVKVAFCVSWGSGSDSGIFHKVASQAAMWQSLGSTVGLFVATTGSAYDDWAGVAQTLFVAAAPPRTGGRLQARESAARAARRWAPDVAYVRHGLVYPGLLTIARRVPLVVEINGDDLVESHRLGTGQRLTTRLSHGTGLRSAAGLVFVTHELAERHSFTRYAKPSLVVPNGIDLASVPTLPVSPGTRRLIFLGHPHTPWHGTDKLVDLARRLPDWRVDLVGPAAADLTGPLPDNLRAHGLLQANGYAPLMAEADLAIGSVAMDRAGITEASPLKVREYLAAGLPTVIGYRDSDFPDGAEFLLELPATEGNMAEAAARIPPFAARWRGRRVPRAEVAHLDVRTKETVRLRFLETRLAAHSAGADRGT